MTYDSSNREAIEALPTGKLVDRVREAMGQGCIRPCHVYDMVDEVLQRLVFLADSAEDIERDNAALRKGMVAQCHCKHFKGLHENDYADCLVVCDRFDDDYVSMANCQYCKEFELVNQESLAAGDNT